MQPLNIAVIDDDEITLELIVDAVASELPVNVVSFSNSALAREFLLKQTSDSLDMVISDMVMPGKICLPVASHCGLPDADAILHYNCVLRGRTV